MKDPNLEADRQAENDLEFAKSGLQKGFYSQVCFLSQLEVYTKKQAEEAVMGAERLVLFARDLLKNK